MTVRVSVLTLQPAPYETLHERWRRIEELGFDGIWVADGLAELGGALAFDAWAVLGGLAQATSRVRVGTLVSTVTLRHPAVLAKAAQTIDHISNGRLDVGIGLGDPVDRRTLGIAEWSTDERIGRLIETLQIADGLLRGEDVSYEGTYYRCTLRIAPPRQRPRPPLLVAANGPRAIAVAARFADTWNTLGGQPEGDLDPVPLSEALGRTRRQLELLEEACGRLGRDPHSIRRSMLAYRVRPPLFASVGRFEDVIGRYRELGIDEFIVTWPGVITRSPEQEAVLELTAAEVLPRLRS